MAGDAIEVIQYCKICESRLSSFSEKKENLMLSKIDELWCENCQSNVPASRDVDGRLTAIAEEMSSYPRSLPE